MALAQGEPVGTDAVNELSQCRISRSQVRQRLLDAAGGRAPIRGMESRMVHRLEQQEALVHGLTATPGAEQSAGAEDAVSGDEDGERVAGQQPPQLRGAALN